MHTIINARAADGLFMRTALFAGAIFEVAASYVLYLAMLVLAWQERVRERRALNALDDRLLRDIGISRADADRELRKPFWQI
jgi:uncharacterized protein YjiS (DUF1127 family)